MDWKTAITEVKDNDVRVRGYSLPDLLGKLTYSQMVALLLTGELPSPEEHIVLDAILVAASERGVRASSALITRQAAAAGAAVSPAVLGGLLSLSLEGGSAVKACMEAIYATMDLVAESNVSLDEAAMKIVKERIDSDGNLAGFGAAADGPEAVSATLVGLVEGLNLPDAGGIEVIKALEVAFAAHTDEHTPVNLHGAIAASLCELSYPPELGDAFVLMGRLPSLMTHFAEERAREKPGRFVDPTTCSFDGQGPRELI